MLKVFLLNILVFSLGLGDCAYALGIEDAPLAKKYPQKIELIKNFWEKFRRSMVIGHESGDDLAAQLLLSETEQELLDSGVLESEISELRAFSKDLIADEKQESVKILTHDEGIDLAENLEKLPVATIEDRLGEFIAAHDSQQRSHFESQFKELKDLKAFTTCCKESGDVPYRLSLGNFLFSILQSDGADFSKKNYQRAVDVFLNQVEVYVTNVPAPNSQWLAHYGPSSLWSVLLKRWLELHPIARKWLDLRTMGETLVLMPKFVTAHWLTIALYGLGSVSVVGQTWKYVEQSRPFDAHIYSGLTAMGLLWGMTLVLAYNTRLKLHKEIPLAGLQFLKGCKERMGSVSKR